MSAALIVLRMQNDRRTGGEASVPLNTSFLIIYSNTQHITALLRREMFVKSSHAGVDCKHHPDMNRSTSKNAVVCSHVCVKPRKTLQLPKIQTHSDESSTKSWLKSPACRQPETEESNQSQNDQEQTTAFMFRF